MKKITITKKVAKQIAKVCKDVLKNQAYTAFAKLETHDNTATLMLTNTKYIVFFHLPCQTVVSELEGQDYNMFFNTEHIFDLISIFNRISTKREDNLYINENGISHDGIDYQIYQSVVPEKIKKVNLEAAKGKPVEDYKGSLKFDGKILSGLIPDCEVDIELRYNDFSNIHTIKVTGKIDKDVSIEAYLAGMR